MKCATGLSFAFLLFLVAAAGRAEETYTTKFKPLAKGDRMHFDIKEDDSKRIKSFDPDGKKVEDKETKETLHRVYEDSYLEVVDGAPTVLLRRYERAERTLDKRTSKLPFHGHTLRIDKKEDRYEFQIDGEKVDPAESGELLKEVARGFNRVRWNEFFAPDRPVKLDERWKANPAKVIDLLALGSQFDIDKDQVETTCKLVRVYARDGKQYGRFEIHVLIPLKAMKSGDKRTPIKASWLEIEVAPEGVIDGSSRNCEMSGVMRTVVNVKGRDRAGVETSSRISGEVNFLEKVVELPRK